MVKVKTQFTIVHVCRNTQSPSLTIMLFFVLIKFNHISLAIQVIFISDLQ